MSLNPERLQRLDRSLKLALDHEWPQLNKVQREVTRLRPTPIAKPKGAASLPAVATVATDGGENRLRLEPIRMQVLRVADSNGEIYFEDFVAQSLQPDEILRYFFRSDERLQKFLNYLKVDWKELLPRSEFQKAQLLTMLRELMEWAALLKLASQPPAKLLIRDGLLRSILLPEIVFRKLQKQFEKFTAKHNHLLVGVAKRSSVINYLSVAFGLSESFSDGAPAYLKIPEEMEREAAPSNYRWIDGRAMGQLYIARLDRGEGVPLMPVDVAAWQTSRVAEVMSLLHESARASFPLRGYPHALIQAHEHARLGGLEIEMLEHLLLQQIAERDPQVAKQAQLLRLLGQRLAEDVSSGE
jgi:hypothetical protein